MLLTTLEGNRQRLDGGAMYGNAPRPLWERWSPPDDRHRIELACRCLLVEETVAGRTRRVLLETGIGTFFAPELRDRYGVVESDHRLMAALAALGLTDADIDVVVLSHLHFDHAGGLLSAWSPDSAPHLLFPRATFIVGTEAWDRATHPHPRDRASYIEALPGLLTESGRLERVAGDHSPTLGPGWRFHRSEGHTPGLLCTEVPTAFGPLVFAADLIPGVPWVHVPITMGYDRYPERLIDEKRELLTDLVGRGGWLLFTHDPAVAAGKVTVDAKGRFGVTETVGGWVRAPGA